MIEPKNQVPASIASDASDWYARLRAQDVSEFDAVRFRAWLLGDPARRREFEAIDSFWEDLAAIEKSPEVVRVRGQIAARRRASWRHRVSWAMAASLVV